MTVNELMIYMKTARGRLNELQNIQSRVSSRDVYITDSGERRTEPQYDSNAVDKKICEIEKMLFKADVAIKQSNARTEVNFEMNIDDLLEPMSRN